MKKQIETHHIIFGTWILGFLIIFITCTSMYLLKYNKTSEPIFTPTPVITTHTDITCTITDIHYKHWFAGTHRCQLPIV